MTTLYGIKNCDSVKKARKWLEEQGIEFNFHDFRVDGLDAGQVKSWVSQLGWEQLVNKRSTTWKQLDDETKANLSNESVVSVVLEHPTLIKRPLLDQDSHYSVGFKAADYQQKFA